MLLCLSSFLFFTQHVCLHVWQTFHWCFIGNFATITPCFQTVIGKTRFLISSLGLMILAGVVQANFGFTSWTRCLQLNFWLFTTEWFEREPCMEIQMTDDYVHDFVLKSSPHERCIMLFSCWTHIFRQAGVTFMLCSSGIFMCEFKWKCFWIEGKQICFVNTISDKVCLETSSNPIKQVRATKVSLLSHNGEICENHGWTSCESFFCVCCFLCSNTT